MKAARIVKWTLVGLIALQCSNPVDKDVRWRTSVDLPVTANKKFFLGAMMDTLFFNHKGVLTSTSYDTLKRTGKSDTVIKNLDTTMMILKAYPAVDSATKRPIPDTVAFAFPTHDTASDTISEDSLADKRYGDNFGPIPLSGAPTTNVTVPLPAVPYVGGTAVALPAVPVTVKFVYHVELTNTPQNLQVTLANGSSANFSSVQITLGTLGTQTISNLQAGASGTAAFNAANKVIDSVMNVSVTLTPQGSGTFVAGDKLTASFSLNGLTANKVVVNDSLLAGFQRTFTNPYKLTDTVAADYIDIDKGFFIYSVTNHTGLDLLLSVTHRHLWRTDFCAGKTPAIISISDLVGLTSNDSLGAYNGGIANREAFIAGQTNEYRKQNISANRLFPEWDTTTKQTVTKVDYRVNIGTYGRRATLSSADSLLFVIKTTSFKFKEMYGRTMEAYHRNSKPTSIAVKLPWSQAVTDSIRGKFSLQKVLAKVKTRIEIPDSAFIDTINIHYEIASTTHPLVVASADAVLLHVSRDSTYQRPVDITSVVNDYPDSVRVKVSLSIPVNTPIKAVNDLTDPRNAAYSKYIGRMIIHGIVDYNLFAPLCWNVADTATMDLGGDTLDMGKVSGVTDPFKKLTDRHASFVAQVTNYTNVYMRLYALVATDSTKVGPLVDTANAQYIKTNQFTQLINDNLHNISTPGFVNLLGNGILLPPRDSITKVANSVVLKETDLNQLLGAKIAGFRWQVRFLPQYNGGALVTTSDPLYNTDWIKMNSWIHIDGVNSVDSLFSK